MTFASLFLDGNAVLVVRRKALSLRWRYSWSHLRLLLVSLFLSVVMLSAIWLAGGKQICHCGRLHGEDLGTNVGSGTCSM